MYNTNYYKDEKKCFNSSHTLKRYIHSKLEMELLLPSFKVTEEIILN